MPVYEYRCAKCGERFEQYRTVTTRRAARCPECGGRGRKVFRPVGIIFKGSGFHVTDYRKPEEKAEAGDKAEKATSAAPSEAKSDTSGTSDTSRNSDTSGTSAKSAKSAKSE